MSQSLLTTRSLNDPELVELLQTDEDFATHFVNYLKTKTAAEKAGTVTGEDAGEPVALDFLDDFEFEGKRLNLKQKLFVCEFLVDLNALQAYQRAGYISNSSKGPYELFEQPKIRAAVKEAMRHRMERLRINQDRVVRELGNIAFFDPGDVLEGEGEDIRIKNLWHMPKHARKAIKKITRTNGPNGISVSLEFHDKIQALNLIGKHQGMFDQRLVIEDNRGLADRLEAARQKVIEARKTPDTVEAEYSEIKKV